MLADCSLLLTLGVCADCSVLTLGVCADCSLLLQVSADHGERVWRAMSERYFEGKHTQIRPIRLDNHDMLLEVCTASLAGYPM